MDIEQNNIYPRSKPLEIRYHVYTPLKKKKKEVFSHFYLVGFRSNWESTCVKVNIIKKSQAFKKRNIYERFLDEETAMVNHNKTS